MGASWAVVCVGMASLVDAEEPREVEVLIKRQKRYTEGSFGSSKLVASPL